MLEMEFKKPKVKKHGLTKRKLYLPRKNNEKIVGIFNGQSVTVHDWDAMNELYYSGIFGKGTLSRAAPNYHVKKDDIPKIIFEQQFENLSEWSSKAHYTCPKKYLGYVKSDLELSWASIDKFLQSTYSDHQDSWKSWKEKHNHNSESSKKNKKNTNDSSFLEFKSDEHYVDKEFVHLVNGILQSKHCRKPNNSESTEETVIVLSFDCNQDDLNSSLSNVNARLERLPYIAEENLNLNLEESFFLKSVLGCLTILDLNLSELNVSDLWDKFHAAEKNFLERYITYHYYRSKGWVVRSGLKFGGDYLLYKDNPDYFHSSYLVKVLDRREQLSWREFIAMNRLVETFNKDLVLSCVTPVKTTTAKVSFPEEVQNCTVQEVLVRRWFPSKERFSKEESAS